MKLILNKNKLNINLPQFLRQSGYIFHQDRNTGKDSFVRPLGRGFYPRLHLYYNETNEQFILNLHLDQKQASYGGSHMHNGEYEGEVVEREIARLKQIIVGLVAINKPKESAQFKNQNTNSQFSIIGHGKMEEEQLLPRNNSWFKKVLNFFHY
jgi:hypothetical protein